jgi:hypothetical protein
MMFPIADDQLLTVLFRRYAGKAWCYNGDGYAGLAWTDEEPKPTEQELLAQFADVEAEIVAEKQAQAEVAAQKDAAKQSARTKLAALGLSEAEVNALLGAPATEVAE